MNNGLYNIRCFWCDCLKYFLDLLKLFFKKFHTELKKHWYVVIQIYIYIYGYGKLACNFVLWFILDVSFWQRWFKAIEHLTMLVRVNRFGTYPIQFIICRHVLASNLFKLQVSIDSPIILSAFPFYNCHFSSILFDVGHVRHAYQNNKSW